MHVRQLLCMLSQVSQEYAASPTGATKYIENGGDNSHTPQPKRNQLQAEALLFKRFDIDIQNHISSNIIASLLLNVLKHDSRTSLRILVVSPPSRLLLARQNRPRLGVDNKASAAPDFCRAGSHLAGLIQQSSPEV